MQLLMHGGVSATSAISTSWGRAVRRSSDVSARWNASATRTGVPVPPNASGGLSGNPISGAPATERGTVTVRGVRSVRTTGPSVGVKTNAGRSAAVRVEMHAGVVSSAGRGSVGNV